MLQQYSFKRAQVTWARVHTQALKRTVYFYQAKKRCKNDNFPIISSWESHNPDQTIPLENL